MTSNADPWAKPGGVNLKLRDDFLDGLKCLKIDDYETALPFFRSADRDAEIDDIYQNRYTSFHGLARVFMGDRNGVKLCRKAAVGETHDVEVYYNLAMAENKLDFRESAYMALRRGLKIDAGHPGLLRLKQEITLREQTGLISGLGRNNILNRLLGIFFRGSRKPYSD